MSGDMCDCINKHVYLSLFECPCALAFARVCASGCVCLHVYVCVGICVLVVVCRAVSNHH